MVRERDAQIDEGILACARRSCQSEYPIIDGIPILTSRVREQVSRDILQLLQRDDLSGEMESLIGDCAGPGSTFDSARQQLSSYAWDHWADLDPLEPATAEETGSTQAPSSVLRLLDAALDRSGQPLAGPVLDAGCAAGRTSYALAERTGELVLGVDLNLAFLRTAGRVLRDGRVLYPRRRIGLAYDRREFDVVMPQASNVDFWACDIGALPFASETFASAVALNLLDSTPTPVESLMEIGRALRPGGRALLACPYDWSPAVTPVEAWIGGHSQRGDHAGAAEPVLRTLLSERAGSGSGNLRIVTEEDSVPWNVRLHDRAMVEYRTHLVVAEAPKAR